MVATVMQHKVDPVEFVEGKAKISISDIPMQARLEIVKRALGLLIKEIPDNYDPEDSIVRFEPLSKSLERGWPSDDKHSAYRSIDPRHVPLEKIGHVPGDRFWTLAQTGHMRPWCNRGAGEKPITDELLEQRILLSRRSLMIYVVSVVWRPTLNTDDRYCYHAVSVDLENDAGLEKVFSAHPREVMQILVTFSNLTNGLAEKAEKSARRLSELRADLSKRHSALYL